MYDHTIRKVCSSGKLTLTVSLPKTHCRELGISAGTKVSVVRTRNGFIITKI